MRTLAIIPARLGATRLPRKPLRQLAGVPLIVRVLQRVMSLGIAERVVVATDAQEVADCVIRHGGDVVMTSNSHPSGTDRVAEVARSHEFASFDAILNVQGDEPFVDASIVTGALRQISDHGYELGTAATRSEPDIMLRPDVVKVVTADNGAALYFSRAPIPYLRDPADATERNMHVFQHAGVYAYTPGALQRWIALPVHPLERIERLEQLRPLAAGMRMGVAVVQAPHRAGIDTESDLALANRDWPSFTMSIT